MKRSLHITIVLLAVFGTAMGSGAHAQSVRGLDPDKALTQYVHQVWRNDEGLPQNTVRALTQSEEGYLWMGTEEGLVRFDGVRFTVFDKSNTEAFEAGHAIEVLYHDQAGTLWIGTSSGGAIRYADGQFTRITEEDGLLGKTVSAFFAEEQGRLWIGTRDAGLFLYSNHQATQYTTEDGLLSNHVSALYRDRQARLWVGTGSGLNQISDDAITTVEDADASSDRFVTTLYEDQAGTLWVGTRHGLHQIAAGALQPFASADPWTTGDVRALWEDAAGSLWVGMKGGGLGRLRNGRLETFSEQDGLSHDWVLALYGDREGSLWIGTEGGGLNQLWDGKFTLYTTGEGLSHDMVMTVFEDRARNLWIGTDGGGVTRVKEGQLTTYTTAHGLSSDIVSSVYQDRAGGLWVGTLGGGLNRFENGRFIPYSANEALPSDAIFALFGGADGSLWVGTDAGLAHLDAGRVTQYTRDDGLGGDFVAAIHEDAEGTLWIGTLDAGLVRFRDGQFTQYTSEDGLAGDMVLALYEDAEGTLWIGTYEGGLSRLKDGALTSFSTKDGLFNDNIYQILEDDQGTLWMSCNKGIFAVSKDTLNAFAEGDKEHFTSTVYNKVDGLETNEMTGGIQPAGWRRTDGTLWFPSVQGAAGIDPQNIHYNPLPPPVVIEEVLVDGESMTYFDDLTLEPATKKIEFQYTGLSFIASDSLRFRFFLEGYDDEWQEAGTHRTATYTNLPPGSYTFRVMARNSDGVWNEAGAAIAFTRQPFYYQTAWFLLLSLLVGFLLTVGAYHVRTRHLRARKRELEALVDARTKDLRTAKEKIEAQAEKLQELDRFKTRFFANVSHEFRTPLTMIVGPLENALEGAYGRLEGPVRRQIEIMLRNALRLMRLINQLLDLSKLEAGKMHLRAHSRNIVEFIEEVVLTCSAFAEQKDIALRFHAESRHVGVHFEPDKLEKVFYNLLSNATKFTPAGGAIDVTVTPQAPSASFPDGAVEIRVRDTGIGIPKEALPHIFDRFRQVDNSKTRAHEGTGIGLALAKELVLLHYGTITANSEMGAGTEFVIVLPRGDAHLRREERREAGAAGDGFDARQSAMTKLAFSARGITTEDKTTTSNENGVAAEGDEPLVLIVEDNADVRDYVASILGEPYRVITAQNGEEGLEKARETDPDLIVSDVMMPKMDGNALCVAIKTDPELNHIPVVLLTARATQEMKIEGLEAGADDYLPKPFNARELLARAKNLIRLRQQERELKHLNEGLERTVEEQVQIILRERIEYEKQLVDAKDQAEQSLQLKSSMLNNMNHEFRTPLTAIQGYAQILTNEVPEDLREFAMLIDESGARLMRTLDAVHQLSRLEVNDLKLDAERMDLVQVARAAKQRFEGAAQRKGLALRFDVPQSEKVEALLNSASMDRIMGYLLDNAIKFTEAGRIVIEVERQADRAVLRVRDTGVGIDPAFVPDLFKAFTQESTGLTRSHDGIGIGLTVAKRLTELLGGSISVESEKGKGSAFTASFPLATMTDQRAAVPPVRKPRNMTGDIKT